MFLLAGLDSTCDLPYKINALVRSVTCVTCGAQQRGCALMDGKLCVVYIAAEGLQSSFARLCCHFLSLLCGSYRTKPNILL